MDNFAAQIRIFEASNRPVRFMHTHGYENESSDGKTNKFIVLTPPPLHYRQDGPFFQAVLHSSQNHYPPVLRATTVEPMIHAAKPSNPKGYDTPSVPQAKQKSEKTAQPHHY